MNEIKSFDERKKELVKKGKEQGFITYEELANSLKGLDLDADSLDELYNLFDENNKYSLEELLEKFAFDIKLPKQVNDSTTNEITWADSINSGKFITNFRQY